MTAAHAIESRAVIAQDAEITEKLLRNLGPLLESLQATQDAVVRVGAVLVVKENWVVTVRQLTGAQQLLLDHAPNTRTSPRDTLRILQLTENAGPPHRGDVHLELVGDTAPYFPDLPVPGQYLSARIAHCAYQTLAPLATLTNLTRLEIVGFPDESLDPISCLTHLEALSILHLPLVTDLSPLTSLTNLRRLELMTLPGLEYAGTITEVASLGPLCALPNLEDVKLLGVRPPDQGVDDLLNCSALRTATITGYSDLETKRLQEALRRRG